MSQSSAHPNLKSYGMVVKLQTEGPDPTLPVGSVSDELRFATLTFFKLLSMTLYGMSSPLDGEANSVTRV